MGFSGDVPRIEKGLALYEADHFAILGLPLTADPKQIRKGYLVVAKTLHPDRYIGRPQEAERANWLFAKLISPANEAMNKDRERLEYEALLQLRIRRLLDNPPADLWPTSTAAQSLRHSSTWEADYQKAVAELATQQYQVLEEAIERTGELSELNLAYLLLKSGANPAVVASGGRLFTPTARITHPPATTATPRPSAPPTSPPQPAPLRPNQSETRFLQALDMMERKQYKEAVQFLTIAIAADPTQPRYYSSRGSAHLSQGNRGMARADFQQALRLDPNSLEAQKGLKDSDPAQPTGSGKIPVPPSKPQPAKPQPSKPKDKPADGGFFGKFFNKK